MVSFVTTYDIPTGVRYSIHPHHRNGASIKSQWTISEEQEKNVFVYAKKQTWLTQGMGWGLHLENGLVSYLGKGQDRQQNLFIAKFVDGNNNQSWHGYPADHQRRPSDIPSHSILQQWMAAKLLRIAVLRKIVKGQPCSL